MKKLHLTLLLCSIILFTNAQNSLPTFGKVSVEDLKMTSCPFEPGAEAMYLYDAGFISYIAASDIPFVTENEYIIRIKIFNEKGFEHANVKIHYMDERKYEQVDNLTAYTYNLGADGKVVRTAVDKKLFYKEKANNSYSAISFTFPDVKVGSVIEYRYRLVRKNYTTMSPWYFQNSLPVRLSYYQQVIPEYFLFTKQIQTTYRLQRKEEKVRGNYANFYLMQDIPSLKSEPYMAARKDYLQRIEFQLKSIEVPEQLPIMILSSWEKLNEDLLKDDNFGLQLKKNIRVPAELTEKLKATTSKTEKIRILHDYVRLGFEWNGVEDIYTDGVKDVMAKKTGTNADLNILLLNLLRDQGIECFPLLVSTRDHGKVFKSYPFVSQFNKVNVLCKGDTDYYVVNAADKFNPLSLIPYDVMGTEGYIVDKESYGFVPMWNPLQKKSVAIYFNARIEGDSILGKASVSSGGYARNPLVKKYREAPASVANLYTSNGDFTVKIDSFKVDNVENDTLSLVQTFQYKMGLNQSGDYRFFTVNLFSGLDKNPFTSEKRFSDVDFGYNQSYVVSGSIALPPNVVVEEMPKNMSMITPDTSIVFKRIFQMNGNMVQFRINVEFKRPVYYVEEYDSFREFYQKLFTFLNEQIVFKTKENG